MPKSKNNNNGERNASDTEAQGNRIQDNRFIPSETKELRTRVQPIPIQNLNLDDTIFVKTVQEMKTKLTETFT